MVLETDAQFPGSERAEPPLSSSEFDNLADTLGRAFCNHANWRAVIADEPRRVRALTSFFRFMAPVIARDGLLFVVPHRNDPVGYITFMPAADAEQISLRRIIRAGVLGTALGFVARLRPGEMAAMQRFNRLVAAHEHELRANPRVDHLAHLYFTGIEPASMGRGIMKRAFARAETRLCELGYSGYVLETTDPANLPVYERFGLTCAGEQSIPGEARSVWFFEKYLD